MASTNQNVFAFADEDLARAAAKLNFAIPVTQQIKATVTGQYAGTGLLKSNEASFEIEFSGTVTLPVTQSDAPVELAITQDQFVSVIIEQLMFELKTASDISLIRLSHPLRRFRFKENGLENIKGASLM